jgi:uncharacterized protein (TIGR00369 family)
MAETTAPHRAMLEWHDQGPLLATKADMSGLDYLTGLVEGRIVAPPVAQVMDIAVVSAEQGRVQFSMPVKEFFTNHLGVLAGGILSTVMDSALGCAVLSLVKPDDDIVTLDLNIDFLRPIRRNSGPVTVNAEVVSLGRSRALSTCQAVDVEGRICAIGKSSCLIRPKAPPR